MAIVPEVRRKVRSLSRKTNSQKAPELPGQRTREVVDNCVSQRPLWSGVLAGAAAEKRGGEARRRSGVERKRLNSPTKNRERTLCNPGQSAVNQARRRHTKKRTKKRTTAATRLVPASLARFLGGRPLPFPFFSPVSSLFLSRLLCFLSVFFVLFFVFLA
jgi:hypothetical protein